MTSTPTPTAIALAAVLAALPALGQERPREEDLFGPPAQQPTPAPPAPEAQRPGEAELFGKPEPGGPARPADDAEARVRRRLGETEDPLKLGGLLYWRSSVTATEAGPPARWALAAPALLDLYLDARPNDRVRGFVLARTFYDPTIGSGWRPLQVQGSLPFAVSVPANPRGVLDQLWLRFDLGRVAFVTAGRQHAKWGVGRFWNPGDFLHPVRRDPLALFDDRAGLSMIRVHVPWERRGWNFYAVGVLERLARSPDEAPPTPSALGALGGGGRAELVLGPAELGLSAVAQRGMKPRLGADLSAGLWDLDLKAELAWRGSPDQPRLDPGTGARQPSRATTAAVGGVEWSYKYSDEDAFTIGAEYLYNQAGYDDDARVLPALLANGLFAPYYTGRHYAGAYLVLPRPGSWNLHTFTLSAIGNLSDRTFVFRLDWSYTLLTHLTLEAFVQARAGEKGGEFRLAFQGPGFSVPPPVADAGLALRLAL